MIDREMAVRRLTRRYEEQALTFPLMRDTISLALYIERNVQHVMENDLLAFYEDLA